MEINKVLNTLVSSAENAFFASLQPFIETHSNFLSKYGELQKSLIPFMTHEEFEKEAFIELMKKIEAYLKEINDWMDTLDYFSGECDILSRITVWNQSFDTALSGFPRKYVSYIPDEFYENDPSDYFQHRIYKKIKKRQIAAFRFIEKRFFFFKNKITGQTDVPQYSPRQNFDMHLFLSNYFHSPFYQLLINTWQRYLGRIALQIQDIHKNCEQFINRYLTAELFDKVCSLNGEGPVKYEISYFEEYRTTFTKTMDEAAQFESELHDIFNQFKNDIVPSINAMSKRAGTSLLPSFMFSLKRIKKKQKIIKKIEKKSVEAWKISISAEKMEWKKDIELDNFQIQAGRSALEISNGISQTVNGRLIPLFGKTREHMNAFLSDFISASGAGNTSLKNMVSKEIRAPLKHLHTIALPTLMGNITQVDFVGFLNQYMNHINTAFNTLSESHTIIEDRDYDSLIPDMQKDEIALKSLISYDLLENFTTVLDENRENSNNQIKQILRGISEIDQIIAYNIEAALNLIEEPGVSVKAPENSSEMITEGIERSIFQLEQLQEQTTKLAQVICGALFQTSSKLIEDLAKLADTQAVVQLKLLYTKAKSREKLKTVGSRFWKHVLSLLSVLKASFIVIINRGKSRYFKTQNMLDIRETVEDEDISFNRYVYEKQTSIQKLPYVYRHLFHAQPITDIRFFEARKKEIEILQKSYNEWLGNLDVCVSVVGEKGSGKTTFLNFAGELVYKDQQVIKINFLKTVPDHHVLLTYLKNEFGMDEIVSFDDFASCINNNDERRICIVENIQNLMLKTMDGFDSLESFLLLMARTSQRIFWVVSCGWYAWRYFDHVFDISSYFQSKIFMGALSKEEMMEIILKRHRLSGYNLKFSIPESLKNSRKIKQYSSENALSEFLEDRFFNELNDFSSGNIRIAMLLWLSSVQNVSEDHLVIHTDIDLDFKVLKKLSEVELFTISSIIQHDGLNAEHHAAIFTLNISESFRILNCMKNQGLLEKIEEEFFLHPFLYRPVVRMLNERNILH